jgi:translation initiation factor 2 subunit 3
MAENIENVETSKSEDFDSAQKLEVSDMLNVGLVGHIDHGKTTLLYKLTGKFTDTHSEELKRGITIKLGYADTVLEQGDKKRYISFVDAPGHEMLMATMLSGAAIIDAAILVIAANEGIKPQTQEHLMALQTKNIKNIIIVQNKIDLLEKHEAERNYKAIKELVKGTVAENAPIIPISAQQDVNIDKIKSALLDLELPDRKQGEPVFLVARSFDINKPGTKVKDIHGGVLGGILKQGKLKVGDKIEIKPGLSQKKANQQIYETIKTKITSIHRGKYKISEAEPGGSLAFETELDPTLTKADSLSGCVASTENNLPEISDKLKLKFSLFDTVLGTEKHQPVEPLKTNELILLSINTSITVGQITFIRENQVDLFLKIPIVPLKGENIGLARNVEGHWRLIGFGEIL